MLPAGLDIAAVRSRRSSFISPRNQRKSVDIGLGGLPGLVGPGAFSPTTLQTISSSKSYSSLNTADGDDGLLAHATGGGDVFSPQPSTKSGPVTSRKSSIYMSSKGGGQHGHGATMHSCLLRVLYSSYQDDRVTLQVCPPDPGPYLGPYLGAILRPLSRPLSNLIPTHHAHRAGDHPIARV